MRWLPILNQFPNYTNQIDAEQNFKLRDKAEQSNLRRRAQLRLLLRRGEVIRQLHKIHLEGNAKRRG